RPAAPARAHDRRPPPAGRGRARDAPGRAPHHGGRRQRGRGRGASVADAHARVGGRARPRGDRRRLHGERGRRPGALRRAHHRARGAERPHDHAHRRDAPPRRAARARGGCGSRARHPSRGVRGVSVRPPHLTAGRLVTATSALACLLAATLVATSLVGPVHVSLARALAGPDSTDAVILFRTRLPRVLLGAVVGGSLAVAGAALYSLVGLAWLGLHAQDLNLLAAGEEGAQQLGVEVERTRRAVFLAASLLVGAAVSVSGMIGFVGLIVPHLLRLILGPDQ